MGSNENGSTSTISPLELESLTKLDDNPTNQPPRTTNHAGLVPTESWEKLKLLIKLYFELYPRLMFGLCGCLLTALVMWWSPWNAVMARKYTRNYMTADYSALEDNFSMQISKVDHWCLFGGSDKCTCSDPTDAESRIERKGWAEAHPAANCDHQSREFASFRPPCDILADKGLSGVGGTGVTVDTGAAGSGVATDSVA